MGTHRCDDARLPQASAHERELSEGVAVLEQRDTSAAGDFGGADAGASDGGGAPVAGAGSAAERARDGSSGGGPSGGWNLNTFLRWSHYHAERQEELRYDADAAGSGWSRGDFVGHCSGLSPVRRAICVAALLGAVVS